MVILYTYGGITGWASGVSRYIYELIKRVRFKYQIILEMCFSSNALLAEIVTRPSFPKMNIRGMGRLRFYLEELYLFWNLKSKSYNLVHHTGESSNLYKWTKKPIVITVHDMIPELFYKSNIRRIKNRYYNIHHAHGIICVSQNTKSDLLRIYPEVSENKIRVIYHGFPTRKYDLSGNHYGKYVLYVGSRFVEYKNFDFFVKSISPLLKDDVRLVCTGNAFSKDELQLLESLSIKDCVINVGYVTEQELANLYHYALCFVYPSIYEGFGLPILEAFANDCPVCLSNSSCFPEVAGFAGAYFDPYNSESIKEVILEVISNPNRREELIMMGRERLKHFSWDTTAVETELFYLEVVNK